jgi:hypothetical protein
MQYRVIQSHRVDSENGGFEDRLVGQLIESEDPLPSNFYEPIADKPQTAPEAAKPSKEE